MKIGILSLVLHSNYGGILQSYALQTVLERMGHEVIVLDKDRSVHRSIFRKSFSFGRFLIYKYIFKKKVSFATDKRVNQERFEKEQYTQAFINKYIHTRRVRGIDKSTLKDVDAIVVGSDQVWRTIYFKNQWKTEIEDAFLKFAEDRKIKRIAYAASFGTDEWEYSEEETKECERLLQMFDAVSVRESSAIELCKNKLGRYDVQHAIDPTLLLTKQDYIHLVEKAHVPVSSGNLMCYVLDYSEEKQMLIKRIAEERNLTPFYANIMSTDEADSQKKRIIPPLEQWIRGFMDAEFVVTDSFHACVFSIIFGKPFVVVGNKKRGMARFYSLLTMFSLNNHLISSIDEYNQACSYDIGIGTINILEKYKIESLSFLKESLN